MQTQSDDTGHSDFGYRVLASALAAVPAPIRIKERITLRDGQSPVVRVRTLIRDITFEELIARMDAIEPAQEGHREQLMAVLVILESLGIVALERPSPVDQVGLEGTKIYATSEPAGYLLRSISKLMTTVPRWKSSIRPDSNIKSMRSVIEAALDHSELNPHLVLAILLERSRENADEDPLRSVRVISVLVKGERVKPDSTTEAVYLHVRKPEWDSYALIGSRQGEGESEEETARLALQEDLETPSDKFELKPSGVKDEYDIELSMSHGVYTRYAFNLFIVEALHDELRLCDDLEYAWLTFEEICNQESRTGQRIITKADLLRRIDRTRGLDSIPTIVTNPEPFLAKSIRSQAREMVRAFKGVIREFGSLAQLVWKRLLSINWWLLLLLGIAGLFVILRPVINQNIPALSNVADVLGIIGFIISLVGIGVDLQRRRRRRFK